MLDPITATGVLSSLANLGDAATGIVSKMYWYFEAVKNAPKHSQQFRQEMVAICNLIDSLRALVTQPQSRALMSLEDSVSELQEMLNKVNERVAVSKTT